MLYRVFRMLLNYRFNTRVFREIGRFFIRFAKWIMSSGFPPILFYDRYRVNLFKF